MGQGRHISWNEEDARAFSHLLLRETLHLGIVICDGAGTITGWNRGGHHITAFTDADVLGHPMAMLFVPEDRVLGLDEHERNAARTVGVAEDERWHLRQDGTRFWSAGVSLPIRRDGGQVTGYVKLFRDASHLGTRMSYFESLIREGELHQQARDRFIGTVVHELRNPLTPLRNAVEYMEAARDTPASQGPVLKIMQRQLSHLERLVEDLVDFTRVQHGKMSVAYEPVVLQDLLAEALDNFREPAGRKGVALQCLFPPVAIEADADPQRLLQVVMNLLNNAIKFTPSGGKVWLSCNTDQSHFSVQVKDNGQGISAMVLPTIFRAFAQAGGSDSHRGAGLGLGLAVVKEIVTLHRGTVEVRSEGPGKGSEFIVRIPLRASAAAESAEPPPLRA